MEKILNWKAKEEKAKGMSIPELEYAIKDCVECVRNGVDGGYYSDEASVYRAELKKKATQAVKKIFKAVLTNCKTLNDCNVVLELKSKGDDGNAFPTYYIKGRKTVWGTKRMLHMKSAEVGQTLSARNVTTRYTVKFL